jgi:SNF2 family DNA or RNA helicase
MNVKQICTRNYVKVSRPACIADESMSPASCPASFGSRVDGNEFWKSKPATHHEHTTKQQPAMMAAPPPATSKKKNRIVILDLDDDDGTSSENSSNKIVRRKKMNHPKSHHYPRLSDSSSDLEAYIRDMKITGRGTTLSDDNGENDDGDDESNNNKNKNRPDEKEALATSKVNRPMDDSNNNGDDMEQQQLLSAWKFDPVTREYYLSSSQHQQQQQNVAVSSSNNDIVVWPELRLPAHLYRSLYSFQKAGVQWAASLHNNAAVTGGCLGDDMGMGKTFTTLTTLGGLMRAGTIHNALVVAPLSVLRTWEKEAHRILLQCVSAKNVHIIVLSSETAAVRRQGILRDALKQ